MCQNNRVNFFKNPIFKCPLLNMWNTYAAETEGFKDDADDAPIITE